MTKKLNLALIYGSVREGRLCDIVAHWAVSRIERRAEFTMRTVDPRDFLARTGAPPSADLATLKQRLSEADAFVVVTPEYNHGYPAALKELIDSASQPWHAKPVAFVSYGGMSGGLRAVEQLRGVFPELHAMTIRDSVMFVNAWDQFDASGRLVSPAGAEQAMDAMLTRLAWWAVALRNAREAAPYPYPRTIE